MEKQMPPKRKISIFEVVNSCQPDKALKAGDKRYHDLSKGRGVKRSTRRRLVRQIQLAASQTYKHQLFTGHRGSGKTTELYRVKDALEKDGYIVAFFGASDSLDLNDVTFGDLMLAMVEGIAKQLGKQGLKIDEKHIKPIVNWFQKIEKEHIETEEAEAELKTVAEMGYTLPFVAKLVGSLTAAIRGKSVHTKKIRETLKENPGVLVGRVNDLIRAVQTKIHKDNKKGLVLIVDQLDRIHRKILVEKTNETIHDQIYIDHGDLMCSLDCHVIYTIPISMTLEAKVRRLSTIYDDAPLSLQMVRVKQPDNRPDPQGINAFSQLLAKRIPVDQVFEPRALDLLIRMSGGEPRFLLQLIQTACVLLDELPISLDIAQEACRDRRNSEFARAIQDNYWDRLVVTHKNRTLDKDPPTDELLFYRYILEYSNGEPWYDIHPLITSLKKFRELQQAQNIEPDPIEI